MKKNCPQCGLALRTPEACAECGWLNKNFLVPKMVCQRCGSANVYCCAGNMWLCYEHTAKQHRSFGHNMLDYLLENKSALPKEAWLYAMQYEKNKLDEKYYDERTQKKRGMSVFEEAALLAKVKPVEFESLNNRSICP